MGLFANWDAIGDPAAMIGIGVVVVGDDSIVWSVEDVVESADGVLCSVGDAASAATAMSVDGAGDVNAPPGFDVVLGTAACAEVGVAKFSDRLGVSAVPDGAESPAVEAAMAVSGDVAIPVATVVVTRAPDSGAASATELSKPDGVSGPTVVVAGRSVVVPIDDTPSPVNRETSGDCVPVAGNTVVLTAGVEAMRSPEEAAMADSGDDVISVEAVVVTGEPETVVDGRAASATVLSTAAELGELDVVSGPAMVVGGTPVVVVICDTLLLANCKTSGDGVSLVSSAVVPLAGVKVAAIVVVSLDVVNDSPKYINTMLYLVKISKHNVK